MKTSDKILWTLVISCFVMFLISAFFGFYFISIYEFGTSDTFTISMTTFGVAAIVGLIIILYRTW